MTSKLNTLNDLEQQILAVWNTNDDLDLIYHASEHFTEDQLANSLLGLQELFELRMQKVWDCFENYVKTQKIGRDEYPKD